MEKQVKTQKEIRQRKFLLVMPLLALPFVTMIFWALGGGSIEKVEAQEVVKRGININLPDANLKDKSMDKMSYYNQAHLDSVRFLEMVKNDPTYKNNDYSTRNDDTFHVPEGLNSSLYNNRGNYDSNTDKIYRKLAELDKEMSKPVPSTIDRNGYSASPSYSAETSNDATVNSSDLDRLELMMNTMNQPGSQDPELNQLDGMLDKILDVQHPERVEERLKMTSDVNRGRVFAVSRPIEDDVITILDTGQVIKSTINKFYSLDDTRIEDVSQNAIQAVIHETQTLVDGATVKLRLINDVFINGIQISKNSFLFGIASLNGERLNVKVNSIRYNNSLFPVELSVYDMDGLDGIYIPGAITRDVAKQSADRSTQALGMASIDPSWQAQAAGAGIEAAKSLLSRKIKLVKVQVKAGYKVLLRNDQENNKNNGR